MWVGQLSRYSDWRRAGRAGIESRPHRDSIPDRPARSQSLYRLSYPAHSICDTYCFSKAKIFTRTPLNATLHVHRFYSYKLKQNQYGWSWLREFIHVIRFSYSATLIQHFTSVFQKLQQNEWRHRHLQGRRLSISIDIERFYLPITLSDGV